MPVVPTCPGSYIGYIGELPDAIRTVSTVSASVTACVGYPPRDSLLVTTGTLTCRSNVERR